MMSTFTGLVLGIVTAAVVTVFYGEQVNQFLESVLRIDPAAVVTRSPVATTNFDAAAEDPLPAADVGLPGGTPVADEEDDHSASTGSAQQPAVENIPGVKASTSPTSGASDAALEQRWADYDSRSASMRPAGSFPWQECFTRASASYGIPESLLLAIASGESNFDSAARSDKDAVGLMQIRWPLTSRHLGIHREADLYDPCTNVAAGARYLAELKERYSGDLHRVVAAYNYGPGRITDSPVPAGAKWYSHYIYQHLQQVLGRPHVASSELVESRPGTASGYLVLMAFNAPHRARNFISYLSSQAPGLELAQRSEKPGLHEVVVLYQDERDQRQARELLRDTGILALGPESITRRSM